MTHHSEPAEAVKVPDLSTESAAAFLIVCAQYFERRPTDGEDAAHWANLSNGAMCRKIATMLLALIEQQAAELAEARAGTELLAKQIAEIEAEHQADFAKLTTAATKGKNNR